MGDRICRFTWNLACKHNLVSTLVCQIWFWLVNVAWYGSSQIFKIWRILRFFGHDGQHDKLMRTKFAWKRVCYGSTVTCEIWPWSVKEDGCKPPSVKYSRIINKFNMCPCRHASLHRLKWKLAWTSCFTLYSTVIGVRVECGTPGICKFQRFWVNTQVLIFLHNFNIQPNKFLKQKCTFCV